MVFGGQDLEFSASIYSTISCVPSELNEALLKREKSSLASDWFGTSRNILAWEFTVSSVVQGVVGSWGGLCLMIYNCYNKSKQSLVFNEQAVCTSYHHIPQ